MIIPGMDHRWSLGGRWLSLALIGRRSGSIETFRAPHALAKEHLFVVAHLRLAHIIARLFPVQWLLHVLTGRRRRPIDTGQLLELLMELFISFPQFLVHIQLLLPR